MEASSGGAIPSSVEFLTIQAPVARCLQWIARHRGQGIKWSKLDATITVLATTDFLGRVQLNLNFKLPGSLVVDLT